MRAAHREVHVIGSIDFVHTLLAEGLFDEVNLWVYPLLLGAGLWILVGASSLLLQAVTGTL